MPRLRSLFVRLPLRLLAFNVLLVVLPASGVHYLGVFERTMLDAQERSMVQQGRLLAAMLAARPDVGVEDVERILSSLERRTTARLRVLNSDGWLVADSSRVPVASRPSPVPVPDAGEGPLESTAPQTGASLEARDPRDTRLYRTGASLYRTLTALILGPRPSLEPAEERFDSTRPYTGSEISEALAGRYGATYRITPGQRSVTLYSALPIVVEDGRVAGAVLVSQTTLRILQDLYEVRLAMFRVLLMALALAAVISAVVSITVARPLARLATRSLALLDARGRLRGQVAPSRRRDEIGDLERALAELARRLGERERFVASFVADLAHELKNPLASIRAATEVAAELEDPGERAQLQLVVEREVSRLEELLDELREVTRLDDEAGRISMSEVEVGALVQGVADARRLRAEPVSLEVEVEGALWVAGFDDALARAIENLLDNAVSFSPAGGVVRLSATSRADEIVIRIDDEGPGIPESHLDQLFERFFSYRPGKGGDAGPPGPGNSGPAHSGLGLAIVRRTVERHGGRIAASNRPDGGASFSVFLPRSPRAR